jgi:phosphoenolpyruvate synthase/pyruvate phosphate dikinase
VSIDRADVGCDALCVRAAYGLALDGRSGAVPADRYWLDRSTLEPIKREIGRKATAYSFDRATGTVALRAVPAAQQDRSALDFAQLRSIGALACRAEAALGTRLALTWVIDTEGGLHLLGARPSSAPADP